MDQDLLLGRKKFVVFCFSYFYWCVLDIIQAKQNAPDKMTKEMATGYLLFFWLESTYHWYVSGSRKIFRIQRIRNTGTQGDHCNNLVSVGTHKKTTNSQSICCKNCPPAALYQNPVLTFSIHPPIHPRYCSVGIHCSPSTVSSPKPIICRTGTSPAA